MRISEFIEKLKDLQSKEGDLEVKCYRHNLDIVDHPGPVIRNIREKRGRESKRNYLNSWDSDKVEEKVCHI